MGTKGTKGKLTGFLRKWRLARDDVKRATNARRDERAAEELEMAKEGLSRRPGGDSF
ncbi:MAG TPA: hypothetical protein VH228_13720 [Nocardioides sp.]|jgi:hypothetical protein|nr:hypothetical protein [Nocardioides sp.]